MVVWLFDGGFCLVNFRKYFPCVDRRGKAASGDIDVLITHPTFTSAESKNKDLSSKLLKKVVSCLESQNLITETLSLGDVKFMVIGISY